MAERLGHALQRVGDAAQIVHSLRGRDQPEVAGRRGRGGGETDVRRRGAVGGAFRRLNLHVVGRQIVVLGCREGCKIAPGVPGAGCEPLALRLTERLLTVRRQRQSQRCRRGQQP